MDEQYELQTGWDYENEGSEFFAYAKDSDWYKDWDDTVGVIESRQTGFVSLSPYFQRATGKFIQNKWGNCLEENQLVTTVEGNIAIKELATKPFILLPSFSKRAGKVVMKNGRAYKTGEKECVRITTDKGSYVLSFDHKVMLSSGQMVAAEMLQAGNSLQHTLTDVRNEYFAINDLHNERKTSVRPYFQPVHSMIDTREGFVVHHKDGDKLNNSLDNLQPMTKKDHSSLHYRINDARYNAIKTQEHRKKCRERLLKASYSTSNKEIHDATVASRMIGIGHEIINEFPAESWTESEYKIACEKHFIAKMSDHRDPKTGWLISAYNKGRSASRRHIESVKKRFGSVDSYLSKVGENNDRVKRIERIGTKICYDIEVFDTEPDDGRNLTEHNFFLCSEQSTKFKSQNICVKNCTSVGAGNGVLSIINQLLELHKSDVRNAIPYYEWIWAAIRCGVQNRPGTSGATISAAMKALNDYGVLFVDDLNENDRSKLLNKDGIQINGASDWCRSMKNWKAAFAKYGDIAERYQIKTTKPDTWEKVLFALNHGCSVVYGTNIKLALKNGEYQPSGKTAHCMAWYGVDDDAQHTFNINSWGDGYGKLKLDIAKRQYNNGYFDCFVIYDIERVK